MYSFFANLPQSLETRVNSEQVHFAKCGPNRIECVKLFTLAQFKANLFPKFLPQFRKAVSDEFYETITDIATIVLSWSRSQKGLIEQLTNLAGETGKKQNDLSTYLKIY